MLNAVYWIASRDPKYNTAYLVGAIVILVIGVPGIIFAMRQYIWQGRGKDKRGIAMAIVVAVVVALLLVAIFLLLWCGMGRE